MKLSFLLLLINFKVILSLMKGVYFNLNKHTFKEKSVIASDLVNREPSKDHNQYTVSVSLAPGTICIVVAAAT